MKLKNKSCKKMEQLETSAKEIVPEFSESPFTIYTSHDVQFSYHDPVCAYATLQSFIDSSDQPFLELETGEYSRVSLARARVVAQFVLWCLHEEKIIAPEISVSLFGGFYFHWDKMILNVHGTGLVSLVHSEIIKENTWTNIGNECLSIIKSRYASGSQKEFPPENIF